MTEEGPPPPKRVKLSKGELENMTKEELLEKWQERELYVESLVSKQLNHVGENSEEHEKVKQQQLEATRRENVLVMRLTTKEQEMQEYMNQIAELKQAQNTSTAQLRSMLLDPAINLMFQRMKKEMDTCKDKLEQAQNDLAAWKFTPDSQTGKRLMAKCRMLLQENEELGKIISSGRTAKLEGEIALKKTLIAEMKKSQAEMDEFLIVLDEDVEGMQSTIYFLQQQLKETKEQLRRLQTDNSQLKERCEALSTSVNNKSPDPPGAPHNSAHTSVEMHSPPAPAHDAGRTAPSPAFSAGNGYQHHTQALCVTAMDTTPAAVSSPTEEEPSRQLVSNHSLSYNHDTASTSPTTVGDGDGDGDDGGDDGGGGGGEPVEATTTPLSAESAPPPKGHHSQQTSADAATNGSVPCPPHVPLPADQLDSELVDGLSKQTGHSSSDVEIDDDDLTQPESPTQSPHYHYQKEPHKLEPVAVGGGRLPSTDDGAGFSAIDNVDAVSSDGWSPSASKHSGGSVGHVDDVDGSSSPSEADGSTDAKSASETTLQNGLLSSSGTPPGDDSPADDET